MPHIVIVGGGITGLALAWRLSRLAADTAVQVTVLERHDRTGGLIRSELVDGYLCEYGPSGFLDNAPATLALVKEAGLEPRLVVSHDRARRRYVFRGGRLHRIPTSIGGFVATSVLSWRGKLRVLLEPIASRAPEGDESIEAFAIRRIGREAAQTLIDPMVAGIFGGDPRELSLRACFPRLWDLERRYGGLMWGLAARTVEAATRSFAEAVARAARRRPRPDPDRPAGGTESEGPDLVPRERPPGPAGPVGRLLSFAGGMSDLVDKLTGGVGEGLRLGHRVVTLDAVPRPIAPGATLAPGPQYLVDVEGVGRIEADVVVLTGPATESAAVLARLDPALSAVLRQIPTAALVVVALGYDAAALVDAGVRLDGFGFLVPRDEPPRLLGVLWESSIYPGRAPDGKVLLRAMLGGARDPWAVHLDDETLLQVVRRDLRRTMGIGTDPEFVRIIRHRTGLPQYTLGHLDRLAAMEAHLGRHPGLFLGGHAYRGVGINACIAEAEALARRVLRYVQVGEAGAGVASPGVQTAGADRQSSAA